MVHAAGLIADLPLAFCGNPLDRAEDKRGDENWMAKARMQGRYLGVQGERARLRAGEPPALDWLTFAQVAPLIDAGADCVLLGLDAESVPHFALPLPEAAETETIKFVDARLAAVQWAESGSDAGQSGILAQALAILRWHARHRFCAHCGAETQVRRGGYQRYCPTCDTEHFPRTDPVAIMLATRGDRCLLGRQARFPSAMFSALAGFVEAGESLEAAVRREVHEESGIEIGRVRYIGSQPWPFPASLMLGFLAEAESETIVLDESELEEVRWVSADDLKAALAGESETLRAPPPIAIARHLMQRWLDER